MVADPHQRSTESTQPDRGPAAAPRHRAVVPALTIVYHPVLRRIEANDRVRTASDLDVDEIRACHRDPGGDLDAMVEHLQVSKHALRRRIQELGLAE